jgi:hypothetical protein
MATTIRVDATKLTAVAVCSRCPWRSPCVVTRARAWELAAAHERSDHPDSDQARRRTRG